MSALLERVVSRVEGQRVAAGLDPQSAITDFSDDATCHSDSWTDGAEHADTVGR